jgi:hypothetical protein
LKAACETSPGNIVTINQPIKVSQPVQAFTPTQINCPCTLVLNNESKVEFELVNLEFTGALSIQSTGKGEAVVIKSALRAPSISMSLGGDGSQISTSQSMIHALAGNLTMTLGRQAKMELYGQYSTSVANGLSATGAVNISAGQNFTNSIADMGVSGNQSVRINSTGLEGLLKLEKVVFRSSNGGINVLASGNKSMLEALESGFYAKSETVIRYNGSETGLKLSEINFSGPVFNTSMTGGVTIVAAQGSASQGKIEMSDIRASQILGGFSVSAAAGGGQGGVKFEKSTVNVFGPAVFQTGSVGTTEVIENSITSNTRITIKTGPSGNCVSTPNRTLSAPVVQSCASTAAARIANVYEPSEMPDLSVFPNPTSNGTLNIKLKETGEARDVSIVNMQGSIIKNWSDNVTDNLSVEGLQTGFYTIQVIEKKTGNKKTSKFVVE